MRSEARFSGKIKSAITKPFAGAHCLECCLVAGFKAAMLKGDLNIFETLEVKELGGTCH